jgi:hypothetical protein
MLGTLLEETRDDSGRYEWLLGFHHRHFPHSASEHTVIMFTVTVILPCTLACDIRHSFPANCTYSLLLFFRCCNCFASLCLKWTDMHLILGGAHCNVTAAVRCTLRDVSSMFTAKPKFYSAAYHIRVTGTVCPSVVDRRRWSCECTVDMEEYILRHIEEDPHSSAYRILYLSASGPALGPTNKFCGGHWNTLMRNDWYTVYIFPNLLFM